MSGIEHPKIKSLIAQKLETLRGIEYYEYEIKTFSHDTKTKMEYLELAKKKLKVLENMIALYGEYPIKPQNGEIVAEIYGDRFVLSDPMTVGLSDCYKAEIYPYTYYGQTCYARKSMSKTYLYLPDGYGKYKFWKLA
jgi:hypothetical protein